MTKISEQRRFTLKGAAGLVTISGEGFFQRDDAIHTLIQSFVHSAHAAVPEFADHAITVLENGIGGQHRCETVCLTVSGEPRALRKRDFGTAGILAKFAGMR
jgi:pyruvate dehydrogenase complex dehydrogenase (E1) component